MIFLAGDIKRHAPLVGGSEVIYQSGWAILAGGEEWRSVPIDEHRELYFLGECFYYWVDEQTVAPFRGDDTLRDVFSGNMVEEAVRRLEGSFVGVLVDRRESSATLFADRLGRVDLFHAQRGEEILVSTDLEAITHFMEPLELSPMGVSSVLILTYTPRQHTIYKNVYRLGVGERLSVTPRGFQLERALPYIRPIAAYGDADLERYWEVVQNAIYSRASDDMNWVEASSGWDSTFVLGMLRREYGANKVRAVTIDADFSTRHGSINPVEVERVKKITGYYGIDLHLVSAGISSTDVTSLWERTRERWAKAHVFGFGPYMHNLVARHIRENGGSGQVVFNAEACDSLHNFGFSQYITAIHNVFHFREYSDKMANYLYGPTFLEAVEGGSFCDDAVYQIFRQRHGSADFDDAPRSDRRSLLRSYLMPFLWGNVRVPFYPFDNGQFMTGAGRSAFQEWAALNYLDPVIDRLTTTNAYSLFVWLYHQFHLQGSTIRGVDAAMDEQDVRLRMPFIDGQIVDMASEMPESWGRGLNYAPTKYPLKWVINNKIDYPVDLLWGGVHSYIMEADQRVSVPIELLYRSGLTDYFKDLLSSGRHRELLDDEIFDLPYYEKLISTYKNGKDLPASDAGALIHLAYLLDRLLI